MATGKFIGVIHALGFILTLLSLPVINAQNQEYDCADHISGNFIEPSSCPHGGIKLELCSHGQRKKSQCVNDPDEEYCEYCTPGEGYMPRRNNCTDCWDCLECRGDEQEKTECSPYENSECRCLRVPPVENPTEETSTSTLNTSCPVCPTCGVDDQLTCPACPDCPTLPAELVINSTGASNCSHSAPSTQSDKCLSEVGAIVVFVLAVFFIIVMVILFLLAIVCDCYKKTKNKDAEANQRQNGQVKSKETSTDQHELDVLLPKGNKGKEPNDIELGNLDSKTEQEHKNTPLAELRASQQGNPASTHNSKQRLLENATKAGLQIRPTPRDGNCFYHSISDQLSLLHLPPQTADQLRNTVVAFMRTNPKLEGPDDIIALNAAAEEDWHSYCQRMSKDGEWADALVLTAMAQMLQRNILVITSSPQTNTYNFYNWVHGTGNFTEKPIMIGHEYELHYESLEPTDKPKAAKEEKTKESGATSSSTTDSKQETMASQSDPAVSDEDLQFVAMECDLGNGELSNLYIKLGLKESEIEDAKYKERYEGILSFKQQAVDVLARWRMEHGYEATREVLLDAVSKCGFRGAQKRLEKEWDIRAKGTGEERPDFQHSISVASTQSDSLKCLLEISIDHNRKDAAMEVAEAVVGLRNSSIPGTISLKNDTKSAQPGENFIKSFDDLMKDLGLIQPLDFYLPSVGFMSEVQDLEVYPNPTNKKILHYWGHAYVRYTSCVQEINSTEHLLRLFVNNASHHVKDIPKGDRIVEGEHFPHEEEISVEFKECDGNPDNFITFINEEIPKYVSAFANTVGGLLVLGVDDKRTVNGIECNSQKMGKKIEEKIKKLAWVQMKGDCSHKRKLNKLHVGIESNKFYNVSTLDVQPAPGNCKDTSSGGKRQATKVIFIIKVFRLNGGVVFVNEPVCPYYSEGEVKKDFDKWRKYVLKCVQEIEKKS